MRNKKKNEPVKDSFLALCRAVDASPRVRGVRNRMPLWCPVFGDIPTCARGEGVDFRRIPFAEARDIPALTRGGSHASIVDA